MGRWRFPAESGGNDPLKLQAEFDHRETKGLSCETGGVNRLREREVGGKRTDKKGGVPVILFNKNLKLRDHAPLDDKSSTQRVEREVIVRSALN